jgi:ABC-type glycerol-3-phosphate transport system permease component
MFIMIIPIYGSLPATYKLIYDLGLNDSPLYLITQIGGFSASMMITYGFFKGVPRAYREAVYIDGGSDFRAFITIGLPMGKNILIAYFLLNFITLWNNYETPLLYFNNTPTLSLGLYLFQQEIQYAANYPAYFAGALIAMLPILLIFIFFADKLMGQMYSGGLKG